MAAQVQQSSLFKKLGARIAEAHEATKDAPVTFGNQRLPDGIENGIARLVTMELGEHKDGDNKGKVFFRAAGVVQVPKEHNGIKCAGQQTSVVVPLYDTPDRKTKDGTPKMFAFHWQAFLNVFKQFRVSMPPAAMPGESKEAASERIASYLMAAGNILITQQQPDGSRGVCFRFRTWKGAKATTGKYAGKEPLVNEEWLGITEYNAPFNPAAAVSTNGHQQAPPAVAAPVEPTATEMGPEPFVEPDQVPVVTMAVLDDAAVDALAEVADSDPNGETDDGKDANAQLTNYARSAGMSDAEITDPSMTSWALIVRAVRARSQPQPAAQFPNSPTINSPRIAAPAPAAVPPTAAKAPPTKGGLVGYGGVAGCEVTSVNLETRTVTLKGPDKKGVVGPDKRLLKVPFDQLTY